MTQNRPGRNWNEVPLPDEKTLFDGFAREIEERQRKQAQSSGTPLRRGFHAKLHAGLKAEFQVLADLPEEARFGVFRETGAFPAVVRFSNGRPSVNPDSQPEPRGIAIKLIGVPGPKILPGQEDAVTQDFLATSHSVTSFVRDVKQFMAFVRAEDHGAALPILLARELGLVESFRILRSLVQTVAFSEVRSMVTEHYSSTAPIKLGPFAVKFTIQPSAGTKPSTVRPLTENFLREDLADRLRMGDIVLDFLVQFFLDETRTPIEDTSIPWKPEDTPLVRVAQVRLFQCNLDEPDPQSLSESIDKLSFTPWHAIEDHRPLGNIMRARRVAYLASSTLRGHSPEPTRVLQ